MTETATAGDGTRDAAAPGGVRIPRVRALDGLRGAAVAGVLLFHGGHLLGGYLGVDLFFVLSGFLITSLLLVEAGSRGSVALGHFWARRARRLLPALALLMVGIALYCIVVAKPTELAQIPRRRPGDARVRGELAGGGREPELLVAVQRAVTVAAHVEPRDRGAVLPDLAAGLRRAPGVVEARRGEGRPRDRARRRGGLERAHGGALRPREHEPLVLRHRHARGRDPPRRGPRGCVGRVGPGPRPARPGRARGRGGHGRDRPRARVDPALG